MQVPLLLLHGGLGARDDFAGLVAALPPALPLHVLEFEGHGASPDRARPFRIEHFAENVLEHLDATGISQADLFGYSMGGYVGLYLAQHHPSRVRRLVTLGTKLAWTADGAKREAAFLDPETLAAKVPAFAARLRERHTAAGSKLVLQRTAELLLDLGARPRIHLDELGRVEAAIRLMVGDRDKTVSIEETLAAYRKLPNGELEIVPGAAHPFDDVSPERLKTTLLDFLSRDASAPGTATGGVEPARHGPRAERP